MKRALIVSEQAENDLLEIWAFVAQQDQDAADRLITTITERFAKLLEFPAMGREHNELLLNLRSFAIKNYVVFYQPTENGIEIFRILHGSRDIPSVFDEMLEE